MKIEPNANEYLLIEPTARFRILRHTAGAGASYDLLQQAWVASDGSGEWKDVPVIYCAWITGERPEERIEAHEEEE